MSSLMGSPSQIHPDFASYITQGGNLYNQALSEVHPSAGVLDQVAQMQNQMGNQAFTQGLSGSTIANQALASGETQAFNKDAMAQAQQILGIGKDVGGADVASQLMKQKQSAAEHMMPWSILGNLGGMFLGAGGIPGIEDLF